MCNMSQRIPKLSVVWQYLVVNWKMSSVFQYEVDVVLHLNRKKIALSADPLWSFPVIAPSSHGFMQRFFYHKSLWPVGHRIHFSRLSIYCTWQLLREENGTEGNKISCASTALNLSAPSKWIRLTFSVRRKRKHGIYRTSGPCLAWDWAYSNSSGMSARQTKLRYTKNFESVSECGCHPLHSTPVITTVQNIGCKNPVLHWALFHSMRCAIDDFDLATHRLSDPVPSPLSFYFVCYNNSICRMWARHNITCYKLFAPPPPSSGTKKQ